jgi:hypothetical protein
MPAQITQPPLTVAASANGTRRPHRSENQAGIEQVRRRLVRRAGPFRASFSIGKGLWNRGTEALVGYSVFSVTTVQMAAGEEGLIADAAGEDFD